MLACLPVAGDLSLQLLSHTQMNTGLQKWDTTQKMRSAQYPTPAELDAYAKKVANSPLTIKIFPNSIKVPQRKHIRRTVNGLDTSAQRYSPYPTQATVAKTGLLAIVKGPLKGILKGFEGGRARLLPEVTMNPPSGPYGTQSTLNLQQAQGISRARTLPQRQGLAHPQTLQQQQLQQGLALQQTLQQQQQGLGHPQTLQQQQLQQGLGHPQTLQQQPHQGLGHLQTLQQHQQGLAHQQTLQQLQQGLAHQQTLQQQLQQGLPHSQTLQQKQQQLQQGLAHAQTLQQQQLQQGLPHLQTLQQQQGLACSQTLHQQQQTLQRQQTLQQTLQQQALQQQTQQQQTLQHQQSLQQQQQTLQQLPSSLPHPQILHQPPTPQGLRQLPGMGQPPKLQHPPVLPQAQALQLPPGLGPLPPGVLPGLHGPRKMAEGDAPPNVTVSTSTIPLSMASGRQQGRQADVSSIVQQISQFCQPRPGASAPTSVCEGQIANPSPINRNLLISASSRVSAAQHPGPAALPPPHCALGPADNPPAAAARMPVYNSDVKPQQHHHHGTPWSQHHLANPQASEEGAACGRLHRDHQGQPGPARKAASYPQDPRAGQPYGLKAPAEKPSPSPPVNGMPGGVAPYANGHYFQPVWNGGDASGPQDLATRFLRGPLGGGVERAPGTQYRAGAGSSGQTNAMQGMEYVGGDYQAPCFPDQNLGMVSKIHGPSMSRGPEPDHSRNTHIQVPGYR